MRRKLIDFERQPATFWLRSEIPKGEDVKGQRVVNPSRWETIADRRKRFERSNGFDLLRTILAGGIIIFHSFTLTNATASLPAWFRDIAELILPAFFAVSGYLVSASLERCATIREFILLRLLRIIPPLAAVVLTTIIVVGPLFTILPLREYFNHPLLLEYLANLVGQARFALPGVFLGNFRSGIVNGSLWTIPLELICYSQLATLAIVGRGRMLDSLLAVLALLLFFPTIPFVGLPLAGLPAKPLMVAFVAGALLFRQQELVRLHWMAGLVAIFSAAFVAQWDLRMAVLPLSYGVVWLGLSRVPPMLTRADYSYGLYLCAYPLQQGVAQVYPGWSSNLAWTLPLSLLCAMALWHAVEKPLLSRKHQLIDWVERGLVAPVRELWAR